MEWSYNDREPRREAPADNDTALRLMVSHAVNKVPAAPTRRKPESREPEPESREPEPEVTVEDAARNLKSKLERCIQIIGPYRPKRVH